MAALHLVEEKLAMQDYRLNSSNEPEAVGKATWGSSRPQGNAGGAIINKGLNAGFFDWKKELQQAVSMADSEYPPFGEQQIRGTYSNARSLVKFASKGMRRA